MHSTLSHSIHSPDCSDFPRIISTPARRTRNQTGRSSAVSDVPRPDTRECGWLRRLSLVRNVYFTTKRNVLLDRPFRITLTATLPFLHFDGMVTLSEDDFAFLIAAFLDPKNTTSFLGHDLRIAWSCEGMRGVSSLTTFQRAWVRFITPTPSEPLRSWELACSCDHRKGDLVEIGYEQRTINETRM